MGRADPGIVIPDRGQSHLEIAQAWADQYTGAALNATRGSGYACTSVQTIVEVDRWTHMWEDSYPDTTDGKERFYFSYDRIFVPKNDHTAQRQIAGNTVDYDGQYGPSPNSAFMNFQVGPMYLTEGGWRCDGTGTGP